MTIQKLLKQLEDERFYGTLELRFKAGQVDVARKEQSILIQKAGDQTHGNNISTTR